MIVAVNSVADHTIMHLFGGLETNCNTLCEPADETLAQLLVIKRPRTSRSPLGSLLIRLPPVRAPARPAVPRSQIPTRTQPKAHVETPVAQAAPAAPASQASGNNSFERHVQKLEIIKKGFDSARPYLEAIFAMGFGGYQLFAENSAYNTIWENQEKI